MSTTIIKKVKQKDIETMFDLIAHRYDLLNRLLSFRQDIRWRNALIQEIKKFGPKTQGVFLDVATGTGDLIFQVAKEKLFSQYVGVDISKNMLKYAKIKAKNQPQKITFHPMSAHKLEYKNQSFDTLGISFGLRNVVEKKQALNEFHRVLKPGGQVLILEFFTPPRGIGSALSSFYFHQILPLIGGLLSHRSAYQYLPESVASFYSFDELKKAMEQAGFVNIQKRRSFLFGHCLLITGFASAVNH